MDSLQIDGLLMVIDIEKAFDSVNHFFLISILKRYCFGDDLMTWIKASLKNGEPVANNFVSIHQRHLRFLDTEIFKSISQINTEFMWSFFKQKKLSYNLRKRPILNLLRTQSTHYGANAIHFRGSLAWNNLPAKVKLSNSGFELNVCGCLICR